MKRIFLGWETPLLHKTADYLIENHAVDGRLDLKSVTLVLPGRRALMRLEEILASRAALMDDPAWYPPELLTLEALPEKFYERHKPIAPEMTQWFAWIEAVEKLKDANPELLKILLPDQPKTFSAWISLGRMLAKLHYELAAEGIDFKKVAATLETLGVSGETARWYALAELQKSYANDNPAEPGFLDQRGLWDLQAARLFAIERQTDEEQERVIRKLTSDHRRFYLVGLVDMNALQKRIIGKYARFVTALVFAPSAMASRFDDSGCLRAHVWCDAPLEIDEHRIDIVWQPENEADAVLRKIASLNGRFSTGEMIVGVPDKHVIPFVQERLAQAELPSRLVEGVPVRRTAVYRFLEVLLTFLKGGFFRFKDYAELVRHPDVGNYLRPTVTGDWMTQLDDYHNAYFPVAVDDQWKTDAKRPQKFETLPLLWKEIGQLLNVPLVGKQHDRESAGHWFSKIEDILDRLYAECQNERDHAAVAVVKRTTKGLRSLPAGLPQQFTLAEALELLLTQIETEPIAPPELPNAVELIGWLEMAMDDAPVAIVTGMNDGIVPSYANSDLFLPDALRKGLGVMDNRRRCARDAYALSVLLETRKDTGEVLLVAGRRSNDGDAMLPSRFFFMAANPETTARRVRKFFAEMKPEAAVRIKRALQPGCESDHAFRIPVLPDLPKPIESFNVTELSRYLRCPYRYYLSDRCGLRKKDDRAEELSGGDFGTLIHEMLHRFGKKGSPVRDSASAKVLREFFDSQLQEYSERQYGKFPRATIAVQVERAKARLHAFADWQADWRRQGYEIRDVEFSPGEKRRVRLADMPLSGRIDRIDRHPVKREVVVIDYKTGKTDPSDAYHKAKAEWKDFQLPLYHYILGKCYATSGETIRLAYLPIPADPGELTLQWVDWSPEVIQSGIDRAEEVIREILATDWKTVRPNVISSHEQRWDDFASVCMCGLRSDRPEA